MSDDTIVRPVQHGTMRFETPEQIEMLKALDAAEKVDPNLKDEIRAERQAQIVDSAAARVRGIFEGRAMEAIRAMEGEKSRLLAEAKTVSDDDAKIAARMTAFQPVIAATRSPALLQELWDDAKLTENGVAIRLISDAIAARAAEIERVVSREKAQGQAKGIAPSNPDLHIALAKFQALAQHVGLEFDAWRKAHPPRAERIATLDRQIESAAAHVQIQLDTFLTVFGPRTGGANSVPTHRLQRFGTISVGPGFDRLADRRTPTDQ